MDPNACITRFITACFDGDYTEAGQAESDYRAWILKGGFPGQVYGLSCAESLAVSVLDMEQDRIGVVTSPQHVPQVEKWISCFSSSLQVVS